MKKTLLLPLVLLSGCTFFSEPIRAPELTMAHLEPLNICADEINMHYDGEYTEAYEVARMWYDDIVTLNTDCANKADFYLTEASFKKDREDGQDVYEERISGEFFVDSITGRKSKAIASAGNRLRFDEDVTLAQKEKFTMELHEKTIKDFDTLMRNSVAKHLR